MWHCDQIKFSSMYNDSFVQDKQRVLINKINESKKIMQWGNNTPQFLVFVTGNGAPPIKLVG